VIGTWDSLCDSQSPKKEIDAIPPREIMVIEMEGVKRKRKDETLHNDNVWDY